MNHRIRLTLGQAVELTQCQCLVHISGDQCRCSDSTVTQHKPCSRLTTDVRSVIEHNSFSQFTEPLSGIQRLVPVWRYLWQPHTTLHCHVDTHRLPVKLDVCLQGATTGSCIWLMSDVNARETGWHLVTITMLLLVLIVWHFHLYQHQ